MTKKTPPNMVNRSTKADTTAVSTTEAREKRDTFCKICMHTMLFPSSSDCCRDKLACELCIYDNIRHRKVCKFCTLKLEYEQVARCKEMRQQIHSEWPEIFFKEVAHEVQYAPHKLTNGYRAELNTYANKLLDDNFVITIRVNYFNPYYQPEFLKKVKEIREIKITPSTSSGESNIDFYDGNTDQEADGEPGAKKIRPTFIWSRKFKLPVSTKIGQFRRFLSRKFVLRKEFVIVFYQGYLELDDRATVRNLVTDYDYPRIHGINLPFTMFLKVDREADRLEAEAAAYGAQNMYDGMDQNDLQPEFVDDNFETDYDDNYDNSYDNGNAEQPHEQEQDQEQYYADQDVTEDEPMEMGADQPMEDYDIQEDAPAPNAHEGSSTTTDADRMDDVIIDAVIEAQPVSKPTEEVEEEGMPCLAREDPLDSELVAEIATRCAGSHGDVAPSAAATCDQPIAPPNMPFGPQQFPVGTMPGMQYNPSIPLVVMPHGFPQYMPPPNHPAHAAFMQQVQNMHQQYAMFHLQKHHQMQQQQQKLQQQQQQQQQHMKQQQKMQKQHQTQRRSMETPNGTPTSNGPSPITQRVPQNTPTTPRPMPNIPRPNESTSTPRQTPITSPVSSSTMSSAAPSTSKFTPPQQKPPQQSSSSLSEQAGPKVIYSTSAGTYKGPIDARLFNQLLQASKEHGLTYDQFLIEAGFDGQQQVPHYPGQQMSQEEIYYQKIMAKQKKEHDDEKRRQREAWNKQQEARKNAELAASRGEEVAVNSEAPSGPSPVPHAGPSEAPVLVAESTERSPATIVGSPAGLSSQAPPLSAEAGLAQVPAASTPVTGVSPAKIARLLPVPTVGGSPAGRSPTSWVLGQRLVPTGLTLVPTASSAQVAGATPTLAVRRSPATVSLPDIVMRSAPVTVAQPPSAQVAGGSPVIVTRPAPSAAVSGPPAQLVGVSLTPTLARSPAVTRPSPAPSAGAAAGTPTHLVGVSLTPTLARSPAIARPSPAPSAGASSATVGRPSPAPSAAAAAARPPSQLVGVSLTPTLARSPAIGRPSPAPSAGASTTLVPVTGVSPAQVEGASTAPVAAAASPATVGRSSLTAAAAPRAVATKTQVQVAGASEAVAGVSPAKKARLSSPSAAVPVSRVGTSPLLAVGRSAAVEPGPSPTPMEGVSPPKKARISPEQAVGPSARPPVAKPKTPPMVINRPDGSKKLIHGNSTDGEPIKRSEITAIVTSKPLVMTTQRLLDLLPPKPVVEEGEGERPGSISPSAPALTIDSAPSSPKRPSPKTSSNGSSSSTSSTSSSESSSSECSSSSTSAESSSKQDFASDKNDIEPMDILAQAKSQSKPLGKLLAASFRQHGRNGAKATTST